MGVRSEGWVVVVNPFTTRLNYANIDASKHSILIIAFAFCWCRLIGSKVMMGPSHEVLQSRRHLLSRRPGIKAVEVVVHWLMKSVRRFGFRELTLVADALDGFAPTHKTP